VEAITVIMLVLVLISSAFILLGCIGLHRFPDVYTRLHAATKTTTFGSIFLSLAVMAFGVYMYTEVSSDERPAFIVLVAHTLVALILLLLTNPTGAHAIARAARRSGIEPERAVIDETQEVR